MKLKGKVAIVTGGVRGIGRAVAEKLLEEGASVLVTYVEPEEEANPAVTEMKTLADNYGVKIESLYVDISKLSQIKTMFDYCEEHLGQVSIFVGNAASTMPPKMIVDQTEEDFDYICSVDFKGTYFCVKECGLRMCDGGKIVLISSSSVTYPMKGISVYSPAKAAVQMLARNAALEFGERGINVNCIAPGLTLTQNATDGIPTEIFEEVKRNTPLDRLGYASDVADAVVMLCGADASWISGETILANGGARY